MKIIEAVARRAPLLGGILTAAVAVQFGWWYALAAFLGSNVALGCQQAASWARWRRIRAAHKKLAGQSGELGAAYAAAYEEVVSMFEEAFKGTPRKGSR